jgi:3-hydroxyacyl-[acyl-carrier-protein] dehydratase
MTSLNINQIKRYLPHRQPFLLVDRVDEVVPNASIIARKAVSVNETFFNGHFPGNPVMPGVLQLEAMAQAGALLAVASGAKIDAEHAIYVTGFDDCKFKKPVVPGDTLVLKAKILKKKLSIWKLACEAHVDGKLASMATITATTGPSASADDQPDGWPDFGFSAH